MTKKTTFKQVTPELLDKRFEFVTNSILRQNLSNTLSFIVFLDSLDTEINLPNLYKSQVYKTIIIYTASIVESLLHYKLLDLINNNKINNNNLFNPKYSYKEISKPIDVEEFRYPTYLAYKIPVAQEIKPSTRFQQTIRSALKCNLLTPKLFDYCEEIKNLRNKIHMSSMQEVDDAYTRRLVADVFTKTNMIIQRIERYY